MATVKSVGNPVIVNLPTPTPPSGVNFQLQENYDDVVFVGKSFEPATDISDVLQEHFNSTNIKIDFPTTILNHNMLRDNVDASLASMTGWSFSGSIGTFGYYHGRNCVRLSNGEGDAYSNMYTYDNNTIAGNTYIATIDVYPETLGLFSIGNYIVPECRINVTEEMLNKWSTVSVKFVQRSLPICSIYLNATSRSMCFSNLSVYEPGIYSGFDFNYNPFGYTVFCSSLGSETQYDRVEVVNDYNNDAKTDFRAGLYNTTVFVGNKIDSRQIVFVSAYYLGGEPGTAPNELEFDVHVNTEGGLDNEVVTVISEVDGGIASGLLSFQPSKAPGVSSNIRIALAGGGNHVPNYIKGWESIDIDTLACTGIRYCVYCVNRMGGITSMLMNGKPLESYNRNDWDLNTGYNRLDETARGIKRIYTSTNRRWRLNTGVISEADAVHIDDIMNSPKIVLHDMVEDRLFAVNALDKAVVTQTRRSNGTQPIEYTLNFSEARNDIRK